LTYCPTARRKNPPGDLNAHIATLRQILIDAKLTDTQRYEALYKAIQKKAASGESVGDWYPASSRISLQCETKTR
jgi:hypothetical protein